MSKAARCAPVDPQAEAAYRLAGMPNFHFVFRSRFAVFHDDESPGMSVMRAFHVRALDDEWIDCLAITNHFRLDNAHTSSTQRNASSAYRLWLISFEDAVRLYARRELE